MLYRSSYDCTLYQFELGKYLENYIFIDFSSIHLSFKIFMTINPRRG